jgi:hypothetical protein
MARGKNERKKKAKVLIFKRPSKQWGGNIFNIMPSNYTKKIKIGFCYFDCG